MIELDIGERRWCGGIIFLKFWILEVSPFTDGSDEWTKRLISKDIQLRIIAGKNVRADYLNQVKTAFMQVIV